jgi:hypothetical protein
VLAVGAGIALLLVCATQRAILKPISLTTGKYVRQRERVLF